MTSGQFAPQALGRRDRPEPVHNARYQAYDMRMQSVEQHNKVASAQLTFRWRSGSIVSVVRRLRPLCRCSCFYKFFQHDK